MPTPSAPPESEVVRGDPECVYRHVVAKVGPSVDPSAAVDVACFMTTDSVDADDEVVLPAGADLSRFEKNPVVMLCHAYGQPGSYYPLPVGRVPWSKKRPTGILAGVKFAESSEMGRQVKGLFDEDMLRSFSIGFRPLESSPMTRAEADSRPDWKAAFDRTRGKVLVHRRWQLLELSVAPVPCNEDALVTAYKAKGVKVPAWIRLSHPEPAEAPMPVPAAAQAQTKASHASTSAPRRSPGWSPPPAACKPAAEVTPADARVMVALYPPPETAATPGDRRGGPARPAPPDALLPGHGARGGHQRDRPREGRLPRRRVVLPARAGQGLGRGPVLRRAGPGRGGRRVRLGRRPRPGRAPPAAGRAPGRLRHRLLEGARLHPAHHAREGRARRAVPRRADRPRAGRVHGAPPGGRGRGDGLPLRRGRLRRALAGLPLRGAPGHQGRRAAPRGRRRGQGRGRGRRGRGAGRGRRPGPGARLREGQPPPPQGPGRPRQEPPPPRPGPRRRRRRHGHEGGAGRPDPVLQGDGRRPRRDGDARRPRLQGPRVDRPRRAGGGPHEVVRRLRQASSSSAARTSLPRQAGRGERAARQGLQVAPSATPSRRTSPRGRAPPAATPSRPPTARSS
jgi:hypothetical protein